GSLLQHAADDEAGGDTARDAHDGMVAYVLLDITPHLAGVVGAEILGALLHAFGSAACSGACHAAVRAVTKRRSRAIHTLGGALFAHLHGLAGTVARLRCHLAGAVRGALGLFLHLVAGGVGGFTSAVHP